MDARVPLGGAGKNELVFVTGQDRDGRFVVDISVISHVVGILECVRAKSWPEALIVVAGAHFGDRWIMRVMTREHLSDTANAEDLSRAAVKANTSAYHVH